MESLDSIIHMAGFSLVQIVQLTMLRANHILLQSCKKVSIFLTSKSGKFKSAYFMQGKVQEGNWNGEFHVG